MYEYVYSLLKLKVIRNYKPNFGFLILIKKGLVFGSAKNHIKFFFFFFKKKSKFGNWDDEVIHQVEIKLAETFFVGLTTVLF